MRRNKSRETGTDGENRLHRGDDPSLCSFGRLLRNASLPKRNRPTFRFFLLEPNKQRDGGLTTTQSPDSWTVTGTSPILLSNERTHRQKGEPELDRGNWENGKPEDKYFPHKTVESFIVSTFLYRSFCVWVYENVSRPTPDSLRPFVFYSPSPSTPEPTESLMYGEDFGQTVTVHHYPRVTTTGGLKGFLQPVDLKEYCKIHNILWHSRFTLWFSSRPR